MLFLTEKGGNNDISILKLLDTTVLTVGNGLERKLS